MAHSYARDAYGVRSLILDSLVINIKNQRLDPVFPRLSLIRVTILLIPIRWREARRS